MELSQKFLDTLTDEQKAILEEDEALDSKAALQNYLAELAEKDKAEAAHAEAMKNFLK